MQLINGYFVDLPKVTNISSFFCFLIKSSISKKKNYIESQHLSDAVLKESAFQSDVARTEQEEAKTAKSLQSQEPFDKILPLEQVQGTEPLEIIS